MKKIDDNKLTWGALSTYRSHIYGFTILWIVLFHVLEVFGKSFSYNWSIIDILNKGNMGVDIFLILSGISLYFSINNDKNFTLRNFYKKRFKRIAIIYLLICVPYFILLYTSGLYGSDTLLKMIFFMNKNVNSFWFLLVISICYLIYPFLYKLMESNGVKSIYTIALTWSLFLFVFMFLNKEAYLYYEILLSRIPIFLIGVTLGEKVYKDEVVSPTIILWSLLILVSLGPILFVVSKISILSMFRIIFIRFLLGIQGLALIIVFSIFIQYVSDTKIVSYISSLGKYTLEIYIVHIMLRTIILSVLKIPINTRPKILVFAIVYTFISIVIGKLLGDILNKRKI